jgi:hypothetical protein
MGLMKSQAKSILRRINSILLFFGVNLSVLYHNLLGLAWYLRDLFQYHSQKAPAEKLVLNVQLLDKKSEAGDIHSHYFWQDLIVAKEVVKSGEEIHFDIGSRIDGFIAHILSSSISVSVFDIRPLEVYIEGLSFKRLDLSSKIPDELVSSCRSLSCLHTIEHFGLGRYGDLIDVDGHKKGIRQMSKLIAIGGYFYLSFPVGKEKVSFNAHRVLNPKNFFNEALKEDFSFDKFILVDELCKIYIMSIHDFLSYNFDAHDYSCGIFFLRRNGHSN